MNTGTSPTVESGCHSAPESNVGAPEKTAALDIEIDPWIQERVDLLRKSANRRRLAVYPVIAMFIPLAWYPLYYLSQLPYDVGAVPIPLVIAVIFPILTPALALLGFSYIPLKQQRPWVEEIIGVGGHRAVFGISAALRNIVDRSSRERAEEVIIEWLGAISPKDLSAIPLRVQRRIAHAVSDPSARKIDKARQSYLLAWLNAVEFLGDERSAEAVRKCANLKGRNPHAALVRQKAAEVLPKMEERLKSEPRTDSLLRPSELPAEGKLLRPMTSAEEAEAALVRPAHETPLTSGTR